jgi:hypothetical protein
MTRALLNPLSIENRIFLENIIPEKQKADIRKMEKAA